MSGADPHAITRILCGVDGSAAACRAAEVAGCIARDMRARLTFVSVAKAAEMTQELRTYAGSEGLGEQPVPMLTRDAEACLSGASDIAGGCGVPAARQLVRVGDVFEEFLRTIDDEGADLVVLGHHQRSAPGRLVRKPLSQKIADQVPVKLMLVP